MMAHFKLILAILISAVLTQGEGKDASAIGEEDGIGCRLDKCLKFKSN